MENRLLVVALILACTTLSPAAQSQNQEVINAEQAWVAARRAGDAAALQKTTADDFAQVATNGQIQDKAYATSRPASAKFDSRDANVQVFGDMAVVTSTVTGIGAGDVRQTRVWQKQGGQWMLVFLQSTPIAPPAQAATAAPAAPAGPAPAATTWPAGGSADEREILKVQRGLNEAFANKDAATYATMTADTFVRIGPNGSLIGRDAFLKSVAAAPAVKRVVSSNTDFRVRVYGPIAIWTYLDHTPAVPAGQRMTRVYVKQNGAWKQLVGQTTAGQ